MRSSANQKYQAWLELIDFSVELARAGLRSQGLTKAQVEKRLRERWLRGSRDHERGLIRMLRRLGAREARVSKP
ncbi:MAG: hypothetical protein HY594_01150 [Candidatus Omnitrophica bacterium]|nr:hypothetical protein [Candidatus Omnitrophota bacterium]